MVDLTNDTWYFIILASGVLIALSRFRDRLMQKKNDTDLVLDH